MSTTSLLFARTRISLVNQRQTIAALVLLPVMVVLATFVGYNVQSTSTLRADDAQFQQYATGFYDVEQSDTHIYRWTNSQGRICVPQAGKIPRSLLELEILGNGAVPLGIREIQIVAQGSEIAVVPIISRPMVIRLLVDGATQENDDFCFSINSSASFLPSDQRALGVPVTRVQLRTLPAAGFIMPARDQLMLNLALALTVFMVLRLFRVPLLLAMGLVCSNVLMVVFGLVSGVASAGVGVTNMLTPLLFVAVSLGIVGAMRSPLARLWPQHLLIGDLLVMAGASTALWLMVRMLQLITGYSKLWPLKAGIWPNITIMALIPALLFAAWLAVVLVWLARPREHTRRWLALLAVVMLLVGAIVLPVATKSSIRGVDSLFATFSNTSYEYIGDVPRVGNPLVFLQQFVALSSTLSLHSSTHPPGSILLLWGIAHTFGPGPVIASWVAIALSTMSALAACWLGARIGGPKVAILAGAILIVMPSHMLFSVTSMDAVFNSLLALSTIAFVVALESGGRWWQALLAGGLIATSLFFTYATTQLFFLSGAVIVLAIMRNTHADQSLLLSARHPLRQAVIVAIVVGGIYGLVAVTTGFNVVDGAVQATSHNTAMMRDGPTSSLLLIPSDYAYYTLHLSANLIPYAWYLGPWGIAALIGVFVTRNAVAGGMNLRDRVTWSLLILIAGMLFGGFFNREVERIWAFTYPLCAALIASWAWQGPTTRVRLWRAGLFLSLFFAQSLYMRVMFNLFW